MGKYFNRFRLPVGLFMVAILVAGCGGGGGAGTTTTTTSSTGSSAVSISGTAAVGAPLVGATVTFKCTDGASSTATTSATGTWTISVNALPCAVQVSGGTVNGVANTQSYYSYAANVGTVNVTPLTDMIVALASGKQTPNWFASFAASDNIVNTTPAITRMLASLTSAHFTVPTGSFNPLTASFSAQSGDSYDDLLEALNTSLALAGQTHSALITTLAGTGTGTIVVSSSPEMRTTTFGPIEGVFDATNSAYSWLGIPYAKPPVGTLRWTPPADPTTWTSTLSTKQFGNACAQLGGLLGPQPAGQTWGLSLKDNWNTAVGSEDCLTLNVWRPKTAETSLPVLVFFYGGSNLRGWTGTPDYNGARFAQEQKAIVVTVNYRTGYLGWINHASLKTGDPETDSGNFATLDMIKSLKFVKNNIAAFGGNPNSVTIAGQSAGALNVWGLVVSPKAAGLFHKAISLSGGQTGATALTAQGASLNLLQKMLIRDGLATDATTANTYIGTQTNAQIKTYLYSKSAAYISEMGLTANGGVTSVSANIYDGTVLPPDAATAFTGIYLNNVPVLAGVTNEEGKFYFSSSAAYVPTLTFPILWAYKSNFVPDNPAAAPVALTDLVNAPYLPANTAYTNCGSTGFNLFTQNCPALSTNVFWNNLQIPTLNKMQPLQPKTYAYNFMWNQQPAPWNTFIGAAHVQDVAFMFGNFGNGLFSQGYSTANKPGREALSLLMRKSVYAFMTSGDPNNASLGTTWQPWSPTAGQAKRMELNATTTTASAVMSINTSPTPSP